jgi:hypothetical protein
LNVTFELLQLLDGHFDRDLLRTGIKHGFRSSAGTPIP